MNDACAHEDSYANEGVRSLGAILKMILHYSTHAMPGRGPFILPDDCFAFPVLHILRDSALARREKARSSEGCNFQTIIQAFTERAVAAFRRSLSPSIAIMIQQFVTGR